MPHFDPRSAEAVFHEALDRPPDERTRYLDAACAGDPDLRAEVEALLRADHSPGGVLDTPGGAPALVTESSDALEGERAGPWRIGARIGRGGMASVFLAERADGAYTTTAALKVVRRGLDTDDLLARFGHERQLLARLRHPAIARLLDGGALADGRPYLVMEHVDGQPLDVHADAARLDVRARLELFVQVCDPVQFAHQNLVVHRDLKPGNILVDREGCVRLLDFGIAKVLEGDDAQRTATRSRPRTPRYASPEQVRGDAITTATDVYALGVLLFELLTGRALHAGVTDASELERRVVNDDPPRPSASAAPDSGAAAREGGREALARRLRGDLDAIVLRALRRDPAERYATVQALADDVRRHLAGEPVLTRPPAWRYRAGRFVRRHARPLALGGMAVLALAATTAVSLVQSARARAALARADRERAVALEVGRFLQGVFDAAGPHVAQGRDVQVLRELVAGAERRIGLELGTGSEAAAALHLSLGRTLRHLAAYADAEPHLRRSLALFDSLPDAAPESRLRARLELARLALDAGRYGEADSLLLAAPPGGVPAELDLERISTRAMAAQARGDSAAEGLFRQAVVRARAAFGPGDHRLAQRLHDLGAHHLSWRPNLSRADSLLAEALGIWRGSAAPLDSLALATGLQSMAGLRRRQERWAEAESLYRECLATQQRVLGARHPDVALTLTSLGGVMEFSGRHAEAEALYLEGLRLRREVLGPLHRDVGTSLNNLGLLAWRTGRHAAADTLLTAAAGVYRAALGADHAWVALVLLTHGHVLEARGEWSRLRRLLDEALPIARHRFGDGAWRTQALHGLEGAVLAARGRRDEAARVLRAAHARLAAALEDDDPTVIASAARLRALGIPPAGARPPAAAVTR